MSRSASTLAVCVLLLSAGPAPAQQSFEVSPPPTGPASRPATEAPIQASPPRKEAERPSTAASRTAEVPLPGAEFEESAGGSVPPRHAVVTRSAGLLGQSVTLDVLYLLGAALLGSAIGVMLSGWLGRRRRRSGGRDGEGLDAIREHNRSPETLARTAPPLRRAEEAPPSRSRSEALDRRRPGSESGLSFDGDDAGLAPLPQPRRDPPPRSPAASDPRDARMERALNDWIQLISTRGAKSRQFAELQEAFDSQMDLVFEPSSGIRLVPHRPNTPNQFLIALGRGRNFAVVPTYEYLSAFGLTFSAPIQNPPIIPELFDLDRDDTRQLRVLTYARLNIDESGSGRVERFTKGRLAGYES